MRRLLAILFFCAVCSVISPAQTACSLFWRADSLQRGEIVSQEASQYKKVGHHGPAVENSHCALRLYFNDSGAIDVYSKSGEGMELLRYLWYPTQEQQREEGAGCDEYRVGKTVGLGGIALWDGEKEVKLKASGGRTARVGTTRRGSFAEIIAYGVEYCGDKVDISIRIDVRDGSRVAQVSARELSGRKVRFLTGVNFHEGEQVFCGEGYAGAWGVHPADVSQRPIPIGGGIWFNPRRFSPPERTRDMLRIISKPSSGVSTRIIAASVKEKDLCDADSFAARLKKRK